MSAGTSTLVEEIEAAIDLVRPERFREGLRRGQRMALAAGPVDLLAARLRYGGEQAGRRPRLRGTGRAPRPLQTKNAARTIRDSTRSAARAPIRMRLRLGLNGSTLMVRTPSWPGRVAGSHQYAMFIMFPRC